MTEAIHQEMKKAVSEGFFPSAQLLVVKEGKTLLHQAYGNAELETIFDVASLTKPISTTTLIMQLVSEDKLRLDDQVSKHLPQCKHTEKNKITVRHLLNHSSGLPNWQPYYQTIPTDDIGTFKGKMQVMDAVCNEPLTYEMGNKSIYSDLGFIVLGEIIERITEKPIDKLFHERIAKPLGLNKSFFIPLKKGRVIYPKANFAPTEHCPWRKKVVQGEVHDQNCYAMGGVAGHAGLFTTTTDINKFIEAFLKSYYHGSDFLSKETVERFLPFHNKLTECNSTWLLGWDRPSHFNSQAGEHFSPQSIGHLGYTGCSMWIDLEKHFYIVLLTNRIHPTTTDERIKSFRPMIYNMIFEELIA